VAAGLVLVAGALLWLMPSRQAASGAEGTGVLRTATIRRGDLIRSVRIHGITEAVQSQTVAAPRLAGPGSGALVITKLAAAGSVIQPGDLLVEFDRQTQIKNALDRQAEYLDFVEQIKKKRAEHDAARALDNTELVQAANAVSAAELELRRNEVVSAIDAEKNQQNLAEARARLEQLKETVELKRRAAAAELRILEIQRDKARSAMEHAQKNTEKMAVRSPINGVAVLNTIWKGGQMGEVQEGDEIRPGVPFLQVVNPSAMQVRARVNQTDMPYLEEGQQVRVGLDAYPDLSFEGKVERIAAIGLTSGMNAKVRSFVIVFSINGSDPKLMPDLSASLDVELENRKGVLLAPRDAVRTEGNQNFVWVQRGSSFERRAVNVLATSDNEVALDGLEEGAVVMRIPQPEKERS
jgi:HlyD family secretion protein